MGEGGEKPAGYIHYSASHNYRRNCLKVELIGGKAYVWFSSVSVCVCVRVCV